MATSYAASYIRGLVVTAVNNGIASGTFAGTVFSPGDWNTPGAELEAGTQIIKIRSGNQHKIGAEEQGPVIFRSFITIDMQVQAAAKTAPAAQAAAEVLGGGIEQAVFTGIYALDAAAYLAATGKRGRAIQRVHESQQRLSVSSEGRTHTAELDMSIVFQLYEQWNPSGVPITQIGVTFTDATSGDTLATNLPPS
jgi:hypothetical protein